MTYDYTSPSSSNAGSIAPIDWIEQVITYAKQSGIPAKKIYLGIHLYSQPKEPSPSAPRSGHIRFSPTN